jgi:hypothetical protein
MNNRILIAAIAGVVAAGAFFMLVLKPKRAEATKLQSNVAAERQKLDQAQALLASNQKARETYRAAYSSVVRLVKAIPAEDDIRSLLVQLDSAAKSTKVDFQSIEVGGGASGGSSSSTPATGAALPPGTTVGPAGFPVMPFNFSFKGSFFRLNDFFDRLDSFVTEKNAKIDVTGRLLTLDSLSLAPDGAGFPQMRATVGATSYLVSPLEGATGGATATGPAGATAAPAAPAAGAAGTTPAGGSTPATPPTASSTGVIR